MRGHHEGNSPSDTARCTHNCQVRLGKGNVHPRCFRYKCLNSHAYSERITCGQRDSVRWIEEVGGSDAGEIPAETNDAAPCVPCQLNSSPNLFLNPHEITGLLHLNDLVWKEVKPNETEVDHLPCLGVDVNPVIDCRLRYQRRFL